MLRQRYHTTVILGRFNDGLKWARDLNQATAKVGLPQARLFVPGSGPTNQLILEIEYAGWGEFEKAQATFYSSPEVMSVWRRGVELIAAGTHPWEEFEEEAPAQLA